MFTASCLLLTGWMLKGMVVDIYRAWVGVSDIDNDE